MHPPSFIPFTVACAVLASCVASNAADTIEQRYATRWNVAPIARFAMDREVYTTAARCRIDSGDDAGRWINGRITGTILGKTTWRIPVDRLAPGTYAVTYDLRTPLGAEWIPDTLRVPQIARHTGRIGDEMAIPEKWPTENYSPIACDEGPVEFAWDINGLYARPTNGKSASIEVDLLPATPGKRVQKLSVDKPIALSWTGLLPAKAMTGQVLRWRMAGDEQWTDLLFVGTGEKQFFGATKVSSSAGSDDQGPPSPILDALVAMSGLDMQSSGVHWSGVEHSDPGDGPSEYRWSGMLAEPELYGRGMTYCHIDLFNPWAEPMRESDPERYWTLARRFASAAAEKYGSVGVRYFSLGYNEPECFFRTDKEDFFVEQLTHVAEAVHSAVPDAQVIAGKFSSGDPWLIKDFADHGFRDNFDILDIHPYNNDPLTGCEMGEIVASHQALVDLGMGHKRIFLGEGWGPTRDLKQVIRTTWDEPVSPEEADVTRQYYQNGYRCLVSARADYSPDWVIGAKYFTLNDNVGGTYWKQAARPVYNSKGELLYHLIGELRFGDPDTLKAFFCNGGLIDFFGNPKGQWFFDFPPALPEVRVIASPSPDYMLAGEWHDIGVTVVNANPRAISNVNLGLRSRTGKFRGAMSAEASEKERERIEPGEVWQTSVRARLDEGDPRDLRLAVELQYEYDGEKHVSDDIVATHIRPDIAVEMDPPRLVIEGNNPHSLGVTLSNNRREPALCAISKGDATVALSSWPQSARQAAGQQLRYKVSADVKAARPGTLRVPVTEDSKALLTLCVPLHCPEAKPAPIIDGNLMDWQRVISDTGVSLGSSIRRTERPADDPFPEPPPAKASALDEQQANDDSSEQEKPVRVFGANAALSWDSEALYVACIVEDDTFTQDYSAAEVWRQDSIQLAFDLLNNGSDRMEPDGSMTPGYGPDDCEIALANTPDGPQVTVIKGPKDVKQGVRADASLAMRRDGRNTIYEARLPWALLPGVRPESGARFGMDILVNNFEDGDRYTLGWVDGIGAGKYPALFVPVIIQ